MYPRIPIAVHLNLSNIVNQQQSPQEIKKFEKEIAEAAQCLKFFYQMPMKVQGISIPNQLSQESSFIHLKKKAGEFMRFLSKLVIIFPSLSHSPKFRVSSTFLPIWPLCNHFKFLLSPHSASQSDQPFQEDSTSHLMKDEQKAVSCVAQLLSPVPL